MYYGNVKYRLNIVRSYFNALEITNAIELAKAENAIIKEWARFYGLDNKYRGDGTKTSNLGSTAQAIEYPHDWLEVTL